MRQLAPLSALSLALAFLLTCGTQVCAATINPGGTGSLGTVNYISGNLALGTTVAARGGSTTSSIDGQPVGETFGTVTAGGNNGTGQNAGFAAGTSWHTDVQAGTQVVPIFFRVGLGNLAGVPNVGSQEFAIGSIEIFGRTECCGTQFSTDNGAVVDVLRLDSSVNSTSLVTGNSQTKAGTTPQGSDLNTFTGIGSIGSAINYRNPQSFNELEANGLPNLALGAADVLEIEISAAGNDFVNVQGAATLDGTLDVSLLGGFSAGAGDLFDILNAASIDASGLTILGDQFLFNIVTEDDGTQTLQLLATPEPASIAVWSLLAAVFGLVAYRRQRRV